MQYAMPILGGSPNPYFFSDQFSSFPYPCTKLINKSNVTHFHCCLTFYVISDKPVKPTCY